jgi:thiosulfate dehydrogenase (quinone) large subunit
MPRRAPQRITPGLALLPVRLFLGVTFVYAGYQKLSDPGFLTPGSATYIGTQLHGFANGTPGGFLLRWFALPEPRVAGVGVALAEIAIGLLATAGLLTRWAALAGLGLNFVLFLTASWNTTPYFLGPDLVFCFAWLPLVLVGATDQPALDTLMLGRRTTIARGRTPRGAQVYAATEGDRQTRNALLSRALAISGAATLSIAALAILRRGPAGTSQAASTLLSTPRHGGTTKAGTGAGTSTAKSAPSTPRLPAGAVRVGSSSQLQADSAAIYHDPSDGSPDIVIRHQSGSLSAFSAVCTHTGCTVGFASGVIACPCHGSEFDPNTGAVLRGPAATPLPAKHVIERRGSIYAV